jgi:hypothetical protein
VQIRDSVRFSTSCFSFSLCLVFFLFPFFP